MPIDLLYLENAPCVVQVLMEDTGLLLRVWCRKGDNSDGVVVLILDCVLWVTLIVLWMVFRVSRKTVCIYCVWYIEGIWLTFDTENTCFAINGLR